MTENSVAAEQPSRAPRWLRAVVVGIAGLFYAYAIWNAIARLVFMAQGGLPGIGWISLIIGIVLPAIIFAFAWSIGRKRRLGELSLVLLAGLGLVAVFWLSLLAYSLSWSSSGS